eukprot:368175_1
MFFRKLWLIHVRRFSDTYHQCVKCNINRLSSEFYARQLKTSGIDSCCKYCREKNRIRIKMHTKWIFTEINTQCKRPSKDKIQETQSTDSTFCIEHQPFTGYAQQTEWSWIL